MVLKISALLILSSIISSSDPDTYIDRTSGRPIVRKKEAHDPYKGYIDRSSGRPIVYGELKIVKGVPKKDLKYL